MDFGVDGSNKLVGVDDIVQEAVRRLTIAEIHDVKAEGFEIAEELVALFGEGELCLFHDAQTPFGLEDTASVDG